MSQSDLAEGRELSTVNAKPAEPAGPADRESGPRYLTAINELRARARQQAALAVLGQRALAGLDLATLFDETAKRVTQTLDVELCKILETLPGGNWLLLRAGYGWQSGLVGQAIVSAEHGSQAGYTLLVREPVIVEDLRTEKRFSGPSLLTSHSVVSGISVIIASPGEPFGVLGAYSPRRRDFTEDDVNYLQSVANVLAAAIERKRVEEELDREHQRYRSVFETALDAILVADDAGRCIDVNPKAVEMLGYSRAELLEKTIVELAPGADQAAGLELFSCLRREGRLRGEYRLQRQDGRILEVEFSAVRIGAGVYQLMLRDVSNLKQSSRMREEFLNLAAHELRTPLTTLKGYAQILASRGGHNTDEVRFFRAINAQTDRMAHLVQTLLDLSLVQNGELLLQTSELDLFQVASVVAREAQADAPGCQIQVVGIGPVIVEADAQRVREVLFHLIDNAVKYSPNGGKVSLLVSERGDEGIISVRDEGIGVPREKQEKLFQAFFQVSPMISPTTGMGLGLHISQEIVRRHGGRIWFESEEGHGSTFSFSLRLAQANGELAQAG